jgi:hypothetical protein
MNLIPLKHQQQQIVVCKQRLSLSFPPEYIIFRCCEKNVMECKRPSVSQK